jgi:hypothetical protein
MELLRTDMAESQVPDVFAAAFNFFSHATGTGCLLRQDMAMSSLDEPQEEGRVDAARYLLFESQIEGRGLSGHFILLSPLIPKSFNQYSSSFCFLA